MSFVHYLAPPHLFASSEFLVGPKFLQQRDNATEHVVSSSPVPRRAKLSNPPLGRSIRHFAAGEEKGQQCLLGHEHLVATCKYVVHNDSCAVDNMDWDGYSGLPPKDPVDVKKKPISPRFRAVHTMLVLLHTFLVVESSRRGHVAPILERLFNLRNDTGVEHDPAH